MYLSIYMHLSLSLSLSLSIYIYMIYNVIYAYCLTFFKQRSSKASRKCHFSLQVLRGVRLRGYVDDAEKTLHGAF